jgi:hypothetical protein
MFTLTIYFIALNVYVEFVLIYRPHFVYQIEAKYFHETAILKNSQDLFSIKYSENYGIVGCDDITEERFLLL